MSKTDPSLEQLLAELRRGAAPEMRRIRAEAAKLEADPDFPARRRAQLEAFRRKMPARTIGDIVEPIDVEWEAEQ